MSVMKEATLIKKHRTVQVRPWNAEVMNVPSLSSLVQLFI